MPWSVLANDGVKANVPLPMLEIVGGDSGVPVSSMYVKKDADAVGYGAPTESNVVHAMIFGLAIVVHSYF
jgi:hypothetical protein